MHSDLIPVDEDDLRRALAQVDTALARAPLRPLAHDGTETRLYRLGEDHLLRLPMRAAALDSFAVEAHWVARLAPHLSLAVPDVLAEGKIAGDPPVPWCLQAWIHGTDASHAPVADLQDLADRLAVCLHALQRVPVPEDAPRSARGGPLAAQDAAFRDALRSAEEKGIEGLDPAIRIWQRGLDAAPWTGAPVWLHGDLVPGNLILTRGRLTALIDWAFVTAGDPAYDLIPAWFLLEGPSRERFLSALAPDGATIARARARAAWQCVLALPYYLDTNPAMVRLARTGLSRLADGGP